MRRFVLLVCFVVAVALSANAQLAITEVMSAASTKDPNFLGPDFFELTNFGDQDIDLDGYSFSDNSFDWQTEPFTNFVIEARQSMIMCKLRLTSPIYVETAAEF